MECRGGEWVVSCGRGMPRGVSVVFGKIGCHAIWLVRVCMDGGGEREMVSSVGW